LVSLALALLILALQSGGWLSMLAILLVLVASTGINISLDAAANRLAHRTSQPEGFIGVYTTASDGGAALGPLLGLPLVSLVGFGPVYAGLALALLAAVVVVGRVERGYLTRGG
jgi:predicted MFS family arabinose efflux permease